MNKTEFETRLAELLRELPPRTIALFEGFATAVLNGDTIAFRRIDGSPWGFSGDEVDLDTLWAEHAEEMQTWLNEPDYAQAVVVSGNSMER